MKLLRYGPRGQEKPGVLDPEAGIRDLSALIDDLDPRTLAPATLAALGALDLSRLPRVAGTPRLGPPVSGVGKFIAIGLNYLEHTRETDLPVPTEPIVFPKWTSCICGPDDDVVAPAGATKLDWEVELGLVIGQRARDVGEAEALACVAGYCVANDVSERAYQFERSGGQWGKGKGFDTFGPLGPWLVTPDEVGDPQNLDLWLEVNGERMQHGNTSTMIFTCAQLISYCSRIMTLEPGDVIITGTPLGVGMAMRPPRYLQAGDVMALGIDKLGVQRQRVVWPAMKER